jgi:hypothetical protein
MRLALMTLASLLAVGCGKIRELPKMDGAWRLVSFEDRASTGEVRKPFGEHADGLLVYEPSGRMSLKIAAHAPEAGVGPAIVETGTWRYDQPKATVAHELSAGTGAARTETRPAFLTYDKLWLTPEWTADGKHWVRLMQFERAG